MQKRHNGFVVTESLLVALIGLLASFYGGAITEAETKGSVTNSISYDVNTTNRVCKEFYPKIIITDKVK